MKRALRILAVLTIAGLLALMLGPATTVESSVSGLDKVGHFGGFLLIALSLTLLRPGWRGGPAAVLAVVIGAAVELIQGQIGRDASWGDLLADAVGAVVAASLTPILRPLFDWIAADD